MWDGLGMLLLLSLIMATASFLAGFLPLSLSLSSKQLRIITALGTGVLVGTSLIVIIPEGVETLYSSSSGGSDIHARLAAPLQEPRMHMSNIAAGSLGKALWTRENTEHVRGLYTPAIKRVDVPDGSAGSEDDSDLQDDQYDPYTSQRAEPASDFGNTPVEQEDQPDGRPEDDATDISKLDLSSATEEEERQKEDGGDDDDDAGDDNDHDDDDDEDQFGNQLPDDLLGEHEGNIRLPVQHASQAAASSSYTEFETSHDPHAWVGISLILGFVLMYLIDTLPRHIGGSSQPQRFHISLGQFSFSRSRSVSSDAPDLHVDEGPAGAGAGAGAGSRPSSTTVGLVIHAAADGIALGASSTNSTSNLSFIIFIAIMIHKAPAAFGLTTVLLKQGLSRRQARAHLIVFALAAPVGALVTWAAIHLLGLSSNSVGGANSDFATGVLLLFSGGTFLYVAMHTMQESGAGGHDHGANGYTGVPMTDMYTSGPAAAAPKPPGPAPLDTLITVVGMLLPLLAQWADVH